MDNMEYIDGYFSGEPSDEHRAEFSRRISDDPAFAEDVAFYLATNRILEEQNGQEQKSRFRALYEQGKSASGKRVFSGGLSRYLAAASVLAVIALSVWFFNRTPFSTAELADSYVMENLQSLPVTMGKADTLQTALQAFNEGRLEAALAQFESILARDSTDATVLKYSGITALRLQQYELAQQRFSSLAAARLQANPGVFFQALVRLKRNSPGDREAAKQLLQEVVSQQLEGAGQAEKWLQKL